MLGGVNLAGGSLPFADVNRPRPEVVHESWKRESAINTGIVIFVA